jgi:hypothetical protein
MTLSSFLERKRKKGSYLSHKLEVSGRFSLSLFPNAWERNMHVNIRHSLAVLLTYKGGMERRSGASYRVRERAELRSRVSPAGETGEVCSFRIA